MDRGGAIDAGTQFWATHLRVGFVLFLVESVAVMVYAAVTPSEEFRPLLWVVAIACATASAVGILASRRVARSAGRTKFSLAWTLFAGLALTVVAHFDGGLDSPLLGLQWLPVVFAALAFGPLVTGVCGVATLVELGVVAALDHDVRAPISEAGQISMDVAVIVGAIILSLVGALNRTRHERRERELTETMTQLARHDALTGCLNHRAFYECLEREVERARRYHEPLALVLGDVDNFKSINDAYGHPAGDQALITVAGVLNDASRTPDLVGRLGGDEFAVLLPNTSPDGASRFADRVRLRLAQTVGPTLTLSTGTASLQPADATAQRLVADADHALYEMKRSSQIDAATEPEPVTSS